MNYFFGLTFILLAIQLYHFIGLGILIGYSSFWEMCNVSPKADLVNTYILKYLSMILIPLIYIFSKDFRDMVEKSISEAKLEVKINE